MQQIRQIALALLLIAVIGFAAYRIRQSQTTSANSVDFPEGTLWICLDENREFNVSIDDLGAWYEEHGDEPYPCPNCGSKKTARKRRMLTPQAPPAAEPQ